MSSKNNKRHQEFINDDYLKTYKNPNENIITF